MSTGEVMIEANQELTPTVDRQADRSRHRDASKSSSPSATKSAPSSPPRCARIRSRRAERRADRNLPQAAPRRSADRRHRHPAVRGHVLRRAQVRFLARRPHEVQHQDLRCAGIARRRRPTARLRSRASCIREDFHDTIRYLLKLRKGIGVGRRHRSPRQPPRSRGRRTARKPVPHRPGPHGARHQGKDVGLPGNVDGHAARPGERQARHGRDPRILRIEPAFAVHGSDQSALGDHAQAASLGSWTRRSVP